MEKNKKKLSPCVISWAKYALEIKIKKPKNSKKCSQKYWFKIIDYLIVVYLDIQTNRNKAYSQFYFVKK